MTIGFTAIEFKTAHEAIQWTEAGECGCAVLLDGRHYVMERTEAERLAAAGVEFAYSHVHEVHGKERIITVPIT